MSDMQQKIVELILKRWFSKHPDVPVEGMGFISGGDGSVMPTIRDMDKREKPKFVEDGLRGWEKLT